MNRAALQPGDELPPLQKGPITRQHLVEWCAAENDYYPLHYDERVAEQMKLPGTPIQGTMKVALIGQMLQRWLGTRGRLQGLSARYRGIDLEGDTLTARARVDAVDGATVTLAVWVENSRGERFTEGQAVVMLD